LCPSGTTLGSERFGEPTFADAILDRIVHNAYRLELDGPSMRKLQASDASSQHAKSEQQPAKEEATSVASPVTKPAKRDQK
jgi:hypothetical protein